MKEKTKITLLVLALIALWCFLPQNNITMAYGECSQYGSMAYYDSFTDNCKCISGYIFGNLAGSTYCISIDQWCRDKYGLYAMRDYLGDICKCMSGYVFGRDLLGNTSCVSADQLCRDQYGIMTKYNSLYDKCECSSGYEFSIKFGGGLECKSCFSKYGLNSSYDYLSKQCECNDGYTLDVSNQCIEKQNNVYFLVEKLDLNNQKAIVKSDYDYKEYLIKYGYGCYDSSFGRYVNNKIVINLGTDFDPDSWDKIVLQDNSETCDIISVSRTFGSNDICDYGYVLDNNRCVEEPQETIVYTIPEKSVTCPLNSSKVNNECFCNNGYTADNGSCITYAQNCQNKYGSNSYGDQNYCYCNTGYKWNSSQTACIYIEIAREEGPTPIVQEESLRQSPITQEIPKQQDKEELKDTVKITSKPEESTDDNVLAQSEKTQKQTQGLKENISHFFSSTISGIKNIIFKVFDWFKR